MPAPWVQALLEWYQRHGRSFPWRQARPDPYAVWVAEVMLQQTRTQTVLPYYQRWMERFPTLEALAQASPEEVLRLWEGLGYYRRALALWQAAREVLSRYQGQLPQDPQELQTLPGIGPYTAHAIASLAFGRDVPVVDGNVKRVLARLFTLEEPVDRPAGEARVWELAREHLPPGQAAAYNQALMDLGATVCTPRRPHCHHCPVRSWCRAYALGEPTRWPRRSPRNPLPHYQVVAGVLRRGNRVLLARRPEGALLGGMWEFPGGKMEPGETPEQALKRELWEELAVQVRVGSPLGSFRHAYTHFRITLRAYCVFLLQGEPRPQEGQQVAWVPLEDLPQYPMGKVDRQIARLLRQQPGCCLEPEQL